MLDSHNVAMIRVVLDCVMSTDQMAAIVHAMSLAIEGRIAVKMQRNYAFVRYTNQIIIIIMLRFTYNSHTCS